MSMSMSMSQSCADEADKDDQEVDAGKESLNFITWTPKACYCQGAINKLLELSFSLNMAS